MFRNRIFLKSLAIFFVVEMVTSTVWPTLSYALTAGPTAPEATSFEPVDTTDMVNLISGDLAYNIPLLEVPGPSGGYPLSLSYHAGIQPNEEASWVGLGWTLNPGAITRNVNGFADDHSDVENATRFYWKGGERETYSIGVSYGLGDAASVSAGLSYSQDTYMGSGVGVYAGYNVGLGKSENGKSMVGVGAQIGVSPYGDPYASAGLSLSYAVNGAGNEGLKLGTSLGISTNFKSVEGTASAGVSYGLSDKKVDNVSLLGASISTGSRGGPSIGLVGASYFSNSRSGVVSTSTQGGSVSIPVWPIPGLWVNLGYSKQRYWIDQFDKVKVNGALNNPTGSLTKTWLDEHTYDTYSLMDLDSLVDETDPEKTMGGVFLNYDNYSVNAQGVGGSIRPYSFHKHLIKQNDYQIKENSEGDEYNYYKIIQYQTGVDSKRAEFRFIGDFSNRFEYDHAQMKRYPEQGHTVTGTPLTYNFNWAAQPKSGEYGDEGYTSNRLPGSRHVEWLTNNEILSTARGQAVGLMDTRATGFDRSLLPKNGIGAFVITNESGVKYHYALPVMSYSEYSYSENREKALTFNEFKNPEPYAYSWYLTAVTGPDYVDRGPNGIADGILNEFDWGYWVEFEYGKWTEIYNWRNPSEDYNIDLDTRFKNFSEGRKELYFLDAIRTKTHTALFVKDIRHDAKSTVYSLRDRKNMSWFFSKINRTAKDIITSVTKKGGFSPQSVSNTCERNYRTYEDKGSISYVSRPTSTLKLNEILLLNNSDLTAGVDKSKGDQLKQEFQYSWSVNKNDIFPSDADECDFSPLVFKHHLYQNVLDIYDPNLEVIRNKAQRVLKFGTDYSLTPETTNSFDFQGVNKDQPSSLIDSYEKFGKLTLKSLHFLGKSGADLMPPLQFNYESNKSISGSSIFHKSTDPNPKLYSFNLINSDLQPGDLLKIYKSGKPCYVVVKEIVGSTHNVKVIGKEIPPTSYAVSWSTTKNPPYNKDYFDSWGLYKADLDENLLTISEDAARLVTPVSSRGLDAWSLRSVKTSMGASMEISYEPDQYKKPVLSSSQILRIAEVNPTSGSTNYDVTLYDDITDLDKIITEGTVIDCDLLFGDPYYDIDDPFDIKKTFSSRVETTTITISRIEKVDSKWIIEANLPSTFFSKRPNSNDKSYVAPIVIAGNLSYTSDHDNFGGGIRVSSVALSWGENRKETLYHYNTRNLQNTSGTTSYLPGGYDQVAYNFPGSGSLKDFFVDTKKRDKAKKKFQEVHHKDFARILANARELPPPGVLYEFVTVRDRIIDETGTVHDGPNYSTFQFEVFHDGLIGILYSDLDEYTFSKPVQAVPGGDLPPYDKIKLRQTVIKNYTSQVGSLKNIALYTSNGEKVNETINHYLHDNLSVADLPNNDPAIPDELELNVKLYENVLLSNFKNQGVIEESYSSARFVRQDYKVAIDYDMFTINGDAFHLLGVLSKREEFPSIQIGQTVINYKTGIKTETKNLAFDFYSGQVTKTLSKDGFGNAYISESTPAYRIYPLMGLTSNGGFNMLTQEAANYSYKVDTVDNATKLGLISGGAQTWDKDVDILDFNYSTAKIATLDSITPKNASGFYVATNQNSAGKLSVGQRLRFIYNSKEYYATVVSVKLKSKITPFTLWNEYELDMKINPVEITSTIGQIDCYGEWKVPRKHASYSYIGDDNIPLRNDGLHALVNGQLPTFTAWNKGDATPTGWQKNGEITLYDVHSHALEASDINNQFAATKMTPDQTRVTATVANARYHEFTYSGAEDKVLPNSQLGNKLALGVGASISSALAHTGAKSIATNNQGFVFEGDVVTGKKYLVSAWSSSANGKLSWKDGNGNDQDVTLQTIRKAGNWYLLTGIIQPTNAHIKVWCQATSGNQYFDDFRIHPADAVMVSYVYNQWGELSHVLDNNNLYTEYRYDGMGRLTETFKETFVRDNTDPTYGASGIVRVSDFRYNYGLNYPNTVSVTASQAGPSGTLSPSGSINVPLKGSQTFSFNETCPNQPVLQDIIVDGRSYGKYPGTVTLPNGTILSVSTAYYGGSSYTTALLKNISGPHSLVGVFGEPVPNNDPGYYSCEIDANGCYTGNVLYYSYDACGAVQPGEPAGPGAGGMNCENGPNSPCAY
jgi:hypothetical protein